MANQENGFLAKRRTQDLGAPTEDFYPTWWFGFSFCLVCFHFFKAMFGFKGKKIKEKNKTKEK